MKIVCIESNSFLGTQYSFEFLCRTFNLDFKFNTEELATVEINRILKDLFGVDKENYVIYFVCDMTM